jgi:hypothetical protein
VTLWRDCRRETHLEGTGREKVGKLGKEQGGVGHTGWHCGIDEGCASSSDLFRSEDDSESVFKGLERDEDEES